MHSRYLLLTLSFLIFHLNLIGAQTIERSTEFLRYQIESGTLEELKEIASNADIVGSDSTIESLREALYRYYNITPPVKGSTTIDYADRLASSKIIDLEQRATVLEGSVAISILEGSTYHSISAERIEINNDTKMIYAFGNVIYQTGVGEDLQYFSAENFAFSSDTYNALVVMVEGHSVQKNSDSKDISFFYTAKNMYKGRNNLITLDGVVITSSNYKNPHYRIKADKIWNLGDNEWAAKGIVYYLGYIPILYLPIYYQGDFFFNPVFSYDARRGMMVNFTTYFMGGKQASGLFDFGVMGNSNAVEKSFTLKMMADYYGKLGYFLGLGASDIRANFDLVTGIGFSQTIYGNGSIVGGNSPYEADKNYSYLFGKKLPFRYGLKSSGSLNNVLVDINLDSDPFFTRDFLNRSENPLLFAFLLNGDKKGNDQRLYQSTSSVSYKNQFTFNNSILKYLNIDYISADFVQKSRINSLESSYSPNREFYVPSRINVPNSQIELGSRWNLEPKNSTTLTNNTGNSNDDEAPIAYLFNEVPLSWQPSFYYKVVLNERIFYEPDSSSWNNPSQVDYKVEDFRSYSAAVATLGFDFNSSNNFLSLKTAINSDGRYQQRFGGDDVKDSSPWKTDELNRSLYLNSIIEIRINPFVSQERLSESFFAYGLNNSFFRNYYERDANVRKNEWQFVPSTHYSNALVKYNTDRYWLFAAINANLPTLKTKTDAESGVGFSIVSLSNQVSVYTHQHESPIDSTGVAWRTSYKPVTFFSLEQNSELDFKRLMHYSDLYLKLYGFSAGYVWEERAIFAWDSSSYGWQSQLDGTGKQIYQFIPSYLDLKLDQDIKFKPFWYDRAEITLLFDAEWKLDWHKYNDSKLTSGLGVSVALYKMLDIKVQINSVNRSTYLYVPHMRKKLGIAQPYSFWRDLGNSLNFFNKTKRQDSRFKLANVVLSAHIDLQDWDIHIEYKGEPDYNSTDINPDKMWANSFSFFVSWRPFPSAKTEISLQNGSLYTGPLDSQ